MFTLFFSVTHSNKDTYLPLTTHKFLFFDSSKPFLHHIQVMTNEKKKTKSSNQSDFQSIRLNTIRIVPLLFFQIQNCRNSFDSISSVCPQIIFFSHSLSLKELTRQRRTSHVKYTFTINLFFSMFILCGTDQLSVSAPL